MCWSLTIWQTPFLFCLFINANNVGYSITHWYNSRWSWGYYGLRLDRTSQSSSSGSIPSILARGMKDGFRGSFPSMTKFWGSFSYVGKCVCMCIHTCVSMCACVSVCIESDVACYVLECPSMPVVALMIMFVPSSFHLVYLLSLQLLIFIQYRLPQIKLKMCGKEGRVSLCTHIPVSSWTAMTWHKWRTGVPAEPVGLSGWRH